MVVLHLAGILSFIQGFICPTRFVADIVILNLSCCIFNIYFVSLFARNNKNSLFSFVLLALTQTDFGSYHFLYSGIKSTPRISVLISFELIFEYIKNRSELQFISPEAVSPAVQVEDAT